MRREKVAGGRIETFVFYKLAFAAQRLEGQVSGVESSEADDSNGSGPAGHAGGQQSFERPGRSPSVTTPLSWKPRPRH